MLFIRVYFVCGYEIFYTFHFKLLYSAIRYKLHYEKFADGTVKNIEEEIPFSIPDTWSWCRLKDLGKIVAGGTPDTSKKTYWNGSVNWLTPADLSGYKEKYILSGERKISEDGLKHSSAQLISPQSVLFSSRAPIGYCVINLDYISTNQGFKSIDNINKKMTEYIYYYLKFVTPIITENASGTTFKEISGTKFGQTLFLLPPLAEQQRIVSKIEELFAQVDKIEEERQSLLKLIDKAKDKVLDLAMKGKLVKQDPNDEPASVLLEKIFEEKKKLAKEGKIKLSKDELLEPKPCVDNDYYQDLPKGWIKIKLQKISKVISKGTTPKDKNCYTDNGIGFLRIENLTSDFSIDKSTIKYVTKETNDSFLNRSILEANDILITISGTLGKMAIINERDLPLNTNQAICFIRLINDNFINPKYILYFLQSNTINKELKRQAKVTAIPNLTLEMIKDTEISIPPVLEQKLIIKQIDFYLDKLNKIKDSL